MMVNWDEIKKAYEAVKDAKEKGLTVKSTCENAIVYSMGTNNPVIRIDIKEREHNA